MVFSIILFLLIFFPAFLLVYYLAAKSWKNIVALSFSVFFYMWGAPLFIFMVSGSIILDFYIIRLMDKEKGKRKRWWLAASIFLNVGLLLYFKYANFLVDNVNSLLEASGAKGFDWIKVALPIGISFFTFQKLSYYFKIDSNNCNYQYLIEIFHIN